MRREARREWLPAFAALAAAVALAACGGSSSSGGGTGAAPSGSVLIGLVVPASADSAVTGAISRGADLAVKEINAKGGVSVGGGTVTLSLKQYDDAGDPQKADSAVAAALGDGAVGIVEDGVGAKLSGQRTATAGVPEIVTATGLSTLTDGSLPSVFRLGIGNTPAASLLSTYISASVGRTTVAIIHDDTGDARDAEAQLRMDLPTAGLTVGPDKEVAASATTVDAQLTEVRTAKAGALVVWGGAAFTGRVIAAAHAAAIAIPVFSGPQGSNPIVRQVAGPAGAEGLAFVDSRMTSEADDTAFGAFEHRLAAAEGGPIDAGVKDAAGEEIRQPADTDFFSYDAVDLLAAALSKAGSVTPGKPLLDAFTSVSVVSANGDRRGFRPDIHEGISDGDLYIARIHDDQYQPVKDEPLSASLPTSDQILSHFH